MATNPSVTTLDANQVIQRQFDVADDAQRVSVINSIPIPTSNISVGPNGATAPVNSTEIAGVNGGGNLTPISVDNSGNQNVNVLSSVIPTGAATSANQTTEITNLSAINTATTALNLRSPGSLTPVAQDYIGITIIPSGNGAGQPGTVVYKTGGASGTLMKTLQLVYDSNNNLISATAT